MSLTRKDVARLAGVSTATVSYVLNNGPRPVSAEARKRVTAAVEALAYQPNAIARSLVTKRTRTIGLVIPDILNEVHAAISKSFEDAMTQRGYSVILGNSNEDTDQELAYIQVLFSRSVDGLAIAPVGGNRRLVFSLVESGKHILLLDREIEGLDADCVLFDNDAGAHMGACHLIESGHTKIALINLPHKSTPGRERLHGYERALLEHGIPLRGDYVVEGDFRAQEGERLLAELMTRKPAPTALLVSSNKLGNGVLSGLKRHGVRLPEDVALVIFDDCASYENRTPSITAISTSVADFGSIAAALLLERVNGVYREGPRIVRVPCKLEIRESTLGRRVVNGRHGH